MNTISRLSIIGACLVALGYATSISAQSRTEICGIWIWNPDGTENSAKCYVPEEDSDLDYTNRLVAQGIATTDNEFTKVELKMRNPDPQFCYRFGLSRVRCTASGNLIDWTEFTESTVIWYESTTIPVLALMCSCY
jgi:hypothetical protein